MKSIKEWLKAKLKKGLGVPELEKKLAQLQQKIDEEIAPYGVAPWYRENLWEPTVQLALRDLCRPGDIVFDVGANFGGLTLVMSRSVGLKGMVCAFEASPRIIDICQRNSVWNGCHNVQLYHTAIYSQSHQKVPIYLGSHLNDSIYAHQSNGNAAYHISTLSLDDFVEQTNIVPNLVKMDIEDAEFDALQGFAKTIAIAKPHIILETQPNDTRCLDFLRKRGYFALDLNTYREIQSPADYPVNVGLRNNLYIHKDRRNEGIYNPPFEFSTVAILNSGDFEKQKEESINLKSPLNLPSGRYLIEIDFTAQGCDNQMMRGVRNSEEVLFRYHAYSQLLASSYRDWVIHLPQQSSIDIYFDFLGGTKDETLTVKGAKISKIVEFDSLISQLYI